MFAAYRDGGVVSPVCRQSPTRPPHVAVAHWEGAEHCKACLIRRQHAFRVLSGSRIRAASPRPLRVAGVLTRF
ncbi:hypothetical protein AHAS_Ahas12G0118900 [Arachis hypogaea]